MVAAPSLIRRGRYRAVLEQDLRRLRRRTKGVFDFERTRSGPTALIISLSSFPYQLKLEGMLAAGLELHGCRVVVAVYPGSDLPRRYLECFGLSEFVELDHYVPAMLEIPAFEPDLLVEGVPVGQYVLSTA